MKRLVFIILPILFYSLICAAQDPDDEDEPAYVPTIIDYIIDGDAYVCFDTIYAQNLLKLRKKYPDLLEKIDSLTTLSSIRYDEIRVLESMYENVGKQNIEFLARTVELEKEKASWYAWYRNPYFTFCVGLVVGIGVTVAVVYGIQQI